MNVGSLGFIWLGSSLISARVAISLPCYLLGFLPVEAFCSVLIGNTVGRVELLKPHPVRLYELVFLHQARILDVLLVVPHLDVPLDLWMKCKTSYIPFWLIKTIPLTITVSA